MFTAENLIANTRKNTVGLPLAVPRTNAVSRDLVRARVLSESTILVAAFGEIDAACADDLFAAIERHLGGYQQLVLDLSRLDFFGTAGYSVLHRLRTRCLRYGVEWVLVPGPEVRRLLHVCDPGGTLPTAPNIVSAVATLTRRPHRTPHLRRVGTR